MSIKRYRKTLEILPIWAVGLTCEKVFPRLDLVFHPTRCIGGSRRRFLKASNLSPRRGFGLVWLGLLYTFRAAGALKSWCAVRTSRKMVGSAHPTNVQSRAKEFDQEARLRGMSNDLSYIRSEKRKTGAIRFHWLLWHG